MSPKLPSFPARADRPPHLIECAEPGCNATRRSNHQWDDRAASAKGWFIQKDRTNWCPDHVPEWVEAWRAKQREDAGELTGGFDPGDVCPDCHMTRSRSGACDC